MAVEPVRAAAALSRCSAKAPTPIKYWGSSSSIARARWSRQALSTGSISVTGSLSGVRFEPVALIQTSGQ